METNSIGIIIDQLLARYIGISMITSAPFIIVFFQTALAIRDHIIARRQSYNTKDSEYTLIKWVSIIMTNLGVFQFIGGIILVIKSL